MNAADFRDALRLVDEALSLIARHPQYSPQHLRREFRLLSRQAALLRARWGQPAAKLQRN
jgi:hypothetical protein